MILNYLSKSEIDVNSIFASGGTQSNFMGLLMARDHYAHKYLGLNIKQDGFSEVVHRFRIFCSEKVHYSIKKNAALLGLGCNLVVEIATDTNYRLKIDALKVAIELERPKGNIPIAVVATTGTIDFGSIDPVNEVSSTVKANNLWLHRNGAHGCCFVFTTTHKQRLAAIKYADSVTVDFQKTFFQLLCSNVFLAADTDHFKYISHYADYINPIETEQAEAPNLAVKSIQTTRRFDALKLWFTLRMTGFIALIGLYINKKRALYQEILSALLLGIVGLWLQASQISTIVVIGRIVYGWVIFQGMVRFDVLLFERSDPDAYGIDYSKIHFFQNLGVLWRSLSVGVVVYIEGLRMPFFIVLTCFVITSILYWGLFCRQIRTTQQLVNSYTFV